MMPNGGEMQKETLMDRPEAHLESDKVGLLLPGWIKEGIKLSRQHELPAFQETTGPHTQVGALATAFVQEARLCTV